VDLLDIYFQQIRHLRPLRHEEFLRLHAAYRGGDQTAKNLLITGNLRLVVKLAGLARTTISMADRIQAGTLGLIRAIERFKPELGFRFSTFATPAILHKIRDASIDDRLIHIPRYIFSDAQAREAALMRTKARSLPLNVEWDELAPAVIAITDPEPSDEPDHGVILEKIAALPPRLQEIITRRLAGETLAEIGCSLGLSRERIRQLEQSAHQRLRRQLASAA